MEDAELEYESLDFKRIERWASQLTVRHLIAVVARNALRSLPAAYSPLAAYRNKSVTDVPAELFTLYLFGSLITLLSEFRSTYGDAEVLFSTKKSEKLQSEYEKTFSEYKFRFGTHDELLYAIRDKDDPIKCLHASIGRLNSYIRGAHYSDSNNNEENNELRARHKATLFLSKELAADLEDTDPPREILNHRLWMDQIFSVERRTRLFFELLSLNRNFNFWRDWYQGFLDGKPLDWELQRRVALIPDADWEQGPAHIAEKIEEIKAKFLAEKAPLAETVEFNEATAKFHTVPREIAKPDLLGATLSQVEDALDDVLVDQNNGLHDGSREVRVLRRTLARYANDPQRIEMNFTSVAIGLRRQLNDTEELPKTETNLALQTAVEEGALGIRATHPDVAENREILAQQALREMPDADRLELEAAFPVLSALSEAAMHEDFEADVPQLINDAIGPAPNAAPPLPAATRTFNRVAKMREQLTVKGRLEKIVTSPAFLGATIVTTAEGLFGVITKLVEIGLRLFGVL